MTLQEYILSLEECDCCGVIAPCEVKGNRMVGYAKRPDSLGLSALYKKIFCCIDVKCCASRVVKSAKKYNEAA